MMGMTISQASLTFRILGLRSSSLWLFLEKNFVITLIFLNSEPILIKPTTKFMVCNIVLIWYTYN